MRVGLCKLALDEARISAAMSFEAVLSIFRALKDVLMILIIPRKKATKRGPRVRKIKIVVKRLRFRTISGFSHVLKKLLATSISCVKPLSQHPWHTRCRGGLNVLIPSDGLLHTIDEARFAV